MNQAEYSEIMDRALDVDFLRSRLIPGLDLCRGPTPASRRKDLKDLCSLHGVKLRVQAYKEGDDILGSYTFSTRVITLIAKKNKSKRLIIEDSAILEVFTHELAHVFQYDLLSRIPEPFVEEYFSVFDHALNLERSAEQTAFYVAKNYFPTLSRLNKLRKSRFDTYLVDDGILFIAERMGFNKYSDDVQKKLKNKLP